MNSVVSEFVSKAKQGESVYITDVQAMFDKYHSQHIECEFVLTNGTKKYFDIYLPEAEGFEQEQFIKDYLYARIYNIISVIGGISVNLYVDGKNAFIKGLCDSLRVVFGIDKAKNERTGYAKCINVTDRISRAMGAEAFSIHVVCGKADRKETKEDRGTSAVDAFKTAVLKATNANICGLDVGGTDIKIVGMKDGCLCFAKEYDWNPAEFTHIEQITDTLEFMVRLSCAVMAIEDNHDDELMRVRERILEVGTDMEQMHADLERIEKAIKAPVLLDGIGLSFPDVVIADKILGGETLKTRAIREHSSDYEAEFAKLTAISSTLKRYCKENGIVHITNDGNMAAYTAAVEFAHGDNSEDIENGIFAHTLGTELGTGWIDESGSIPEVPLEVYNCVIDLGEYFARSFKSADVRSNANFNTNIAGTLQRYTSQSGAFRLALKYFSQKDKAAYDDLFKKGFLVAEEDGIYNAIKPKDMRKALLEHLMMLADGGHEPAQEIFREIGRYVAIVWGVTEDILAPMQKKRILFGRFVKRKRCFELMREGAQSIDPAMEILAADSDFANTYLMKELRDKSGYSVAQFGQAVGAVYFAASEI